MRRRYCVTKWVRYFSPKTWRFLGCAHHSRRAPLKRCIAASPEVMDRVTSWKRRLLRR